MTGLAKEHHDLEQEYLNCRFPNRSSVQDVETIADWLTWTRDGLVRLSVSADKKIIYADVWTGNMWQHLDACYGSSDWRKNPHVIDIMKNALKIADEIYG